MFSLLQIINSPLLEREDQNVLVFLYLDFDVNKNLKRAYATSIV